MKQRFTENDSREMRKKIAGTCSRRQLQVYMTEEDSMGEKLERMNKASRKTMKRRRIGAIKKGSAEPNLC